MSEPVLLRRSAVDETLHSKPEAGKRMLEPLLSFAKEAGLPLQILEDNQIMNGAEVHRDTADLWCCIEGTARFVCGGTVSDLKAKVRPDGTPRPEEMVGSTIVGGTEYMLEAGDWLYIPAGVPHAHSAEGLARLFIIKIPNIP